MNTEQTLKAVIDKYKLGESLPLKIRMAMEKSRKENLIRILKNEAGSVFFVSITVTFFLWVKKLGISISITKSALAVFAALIIGVGIITAAGVCTFKKAAVNVKIESSKIENVMYSKSEFTRTPDPLAVKDILSYVVAVSPVEMDFVSDDVLLKYRDKIVSELRNIWGSKAAINIEKIDQYHTADNILTMSIIKIAEQAQISGSKPVYKISAKIINVSNSQVLMCLSEIAENEKDIPDSIWKLAEKISAKL